MQINLWHLETMDAATRTRVMRRAESDIDQALKAAAGIIDEVKARGDAALREFAARFDGASITGSLKATDEDFARAHQELDPKVAAAIRTCAAHVRRHHEQQMARVERQWLEEVAPGVFAGEKITPIPSVGLYVPRGKGAFPSVMYMLCTPAKIAGVEKISVCTPPRPDGGFDAASLVAADMCGVRDVFKVGGAQAIAAMTFGTETIPQVAQVNGPGNPYVVAAKRLLGHAINPGLPSGPSEALVLADDSADPWNTALDLINEAEHGPDSASLLITDSKPLADAVIRMLPEILARLSPQRRTFCEKVFSTYGGIVLCETLAAAIDFCNEYAVEHLLLKVRDPHAVLPQLKHAGEILIGEACPIVLANFGTGVNAVLPTGGKAQTYDCTSVWAFLKRTSLSYATAAGYRALRPAVETLADYEGFDGHAQVLRLRHEAPMNAQADIRISDIAE